MAPENKFYILQWGGGGGLSASCWPPTPRQTPSLERGLSGEGFEAGRPESGNQEIQLLAFNLQKSFHFLVPQFSHKWNGYIDQDQDTCEVWREVSGTLEVFRKCYFVIFVDKSPSTLTPTPTYFC